MSEQHAKTRTLMILVLLVIAFALLAGAFYWFQLRPSKIKKDCANEAENASSYVDGEYSTNELASHLKLDSKKYTDKYGVCLQRNGL